MKSRARALITAMAMLALMAMPNELVAQGRREQVRYSMKDLGTLGGTFSLGAGLNNKGWVSGFATLAGDQEIHATVWQRGGR